MNWFHFSPATACGGVSHALLVWGRRDVADYATSTAVIGCSFLHASINSGHWSASLLASYLVAGDTTVVVAYMLVHPSCSNVPCWGYFWDWVVLLSVSS